METVARIFLTISATVAIIVGTIFLYRYLSVLGHEAYVPTYIEVPVIIEKWRDAPSEEASSTDEYPEAI